MSDRPSSPFRLNLEQQRKRAKELLAAVKAGDAEARRRFAAHHPADAPRLADAQFVIARELGLPSWPRLKAHIASLDRSWAQLRDGAPAPDRDRTTLHIRCGSDIRQGLQQAGFGGEFLEYSNPLCQGPVTADPDWLERRADFVAVAYGQGVGLARGEILERLRGEEEGLAAAHRYQRVVLWFEHDSYDQLILARCLAHFAQHAPARLELISPGRYPGGTRFIGLGQLPPEALRLLWAERVPVTAEMLHSGEAVWQALRAPDPRPLAAVATPAIPQLGRAVRRHCQELPWTTDGLGLTQRLVLRILAGAPRSAGQLFHALMMEHEPLPWMTDLMMADMLTALRGRAIEGRFEDEDRRWYRELLSLTPAGRAVLGGECDWLSLHPPERWVGGVRIPSAGPAWRWDETTGIPLLR